MSGMCRICEEFVNFGSKVKFAIITSITYFRFKNYFEKYEKTPSVI